MERITLILKRHNFFLSLCFIFIKFLDIWQSTKTRLPFFLDIQEKHETKVRRTEIVPFLITFYVWVLFYPFVLICLSINEQIKHKLKHSISLYKLCKINIFINSRNVTALIWEACINDQSLYYLSLSEFP